VGPGAVLDAVIKRKIPSPRRDSNPKTRIVQPVAWSLYHMSYDGSHSKKVNILKYIYWIIFIGKLI
jgi:hypothetical protein